MIPQEVLENQNLKSYMLYNSEGLILCKYVRKPTSLDSKAIVGKNGVEVFPVFFGEWEQVPEEEINALNEKILANKPVYSVKHKEPDEKRSAKKLTDREKYEQSVHNELEKALKLLKEMKEAVDETIRDNIH